ncbi:MAG: 2' O-ribose methyltransferase [Cirrosporium novae-zelandiae]|nr:MAG: 2' O-ribose methyltransferase [Cirrosporium novae-zelandiae]
MLLSRCPAFRKPISLLLNLPLNLRLRVFQAAFVDSSLPPAQLPPLRSIHPFLSSTQACLASSASSKRWQNRQERDSFTKEARLQGLKSRAAFKLLQINEKYRIFKHGQTVVDLGYAPGSWSQVAIDRTSPGGRVLGIDIIPAQPPKGVSTIQGNFLSPAIQEEVKRYLLDPNRGRARQQSSISELAQGKKSEHVGEVGEKEDSDDMMKADKLASGYIDLEKMTNVHGNELSDHLPSLHKVSKKEKDTMEGRTVDVVLSDMSAPWEQPLALHKRSLSQPYNRMMNASGNGLRDHLGSMDLCLAALRFSYSALKVDGSFICKFYQGAEDKSFERRLKKLFRSVHREKPEGSRSDSKECYFVAVKRKDDVDEEIVFKDAP